MIQQAALCLSKETLEKSCFQTQGNVLGELERQTALSCLTGPLGRWMDDFEQLGFTHGDLLY